MATEAAQAGQEGAPTTELVTGVVGDHCANCNTTLAPDQRYCVNCGERRGRARFSYDASTAQPVAAPAVAMAPPPSRGRRSSGATLVAGVATLLIAVGLGVLIGHDSTSTPVRAAGPQVITVGGGGGTGATATNATASNSTPAASHKSSKVKVTKVVVTAKTAKAATAAAGKVLGSDNSLSKNVQQQIGGACSGGAGCQGGKFTGNFFPGG